MATSVQFPTSNAVVTTGWTNPTYAYASDANDATAAPGKNADVTSDFGGFDFSALPAGAVPSDVTVEFEYKVSTTASIATIGAQAWVGSTAKGTEYTDATEPLAYTVRTFSVAGLTRADLTDPGFRVRLRANRGNSQTAVTFNVDYVKVTVTYNTVVSGDGALSASSDLVAPGLLIVAGSSGLSATASAAATGLVLVRATAGLSASSDLFWSGQTIQGSANLAAGGALTATAVAIVLGSCTDSAASALAAAGLVVVRAAATATAAGNLTTSATVTVEAGASLSTTSTMTATGSTPMAIHLDATSNLTVSASCVVKATAALGGFTRLVAIGTVQQGLLGYQREHFRPHAPSSRGLLAEQRRRFR